MRFTQRAGLAAALALLVLAPAAAAAADTTAGTLAVRQPWLRATPRGAAVAGGYVTIVNQGTTADRLTGGSLAAAQAFAVHDMTTEGGVMRMRPTGPLDIPPGATLVLSPAGRHIMFTGLTHGLKAGETVDGTLVFEKAGTVPLRFTVAGIGARGPETDGHAAMPGMPGMDMH